MLRASVKLDIVMRRCTNILHAVECIENKFIEATFNSKSLYFVKDNIHIWIPMPMPMPMPMPRCWCRVFRMALTEFITDSFEWLRIESFFLLHLCALSECLESSKS